MSAEIIMAAASTTGTIIVGIGLFVTWKRNGREQGNMAIELAAKQAKRDKGVEDKLSTILSRLDDGDTGLSAINKSANEQKNNCIQISTALLGRVNTNERDIKELKGKNGKHL